MNEDNMPAAPEPIRRLVEEVKAAGITGALADIINKKYMFMCEHGSHEEVLIGTVHSLGWSDTGGLELYVTNPSFFGRPLISLVYHDDKWGALIATQDSNKFYCGYFNEIV